MIRSCSPPGVKTTVINPAFYLLVWSPRGLQLHRRALIPLPRGTRGEATTARHESFLDAYALAVQFKQGSARGEPDGCGIHIGFRGAGRNRHRRSDLVCNLVGNAAGANPSPAA